MTPRAARPALAAQALVDIRADDFDIDGIPGRYLSFLEGPS